MVGKDEDFRGSDRVKPFFDPAPDCREESGSTNYLLLLIYNRNF
jgi:hypothetical protein